MGLCGSLRSCRYGGFATLPAFLAAALPSRPGLGAVISPLGLHLSLCFLCFLLIFRRILQIGFRVSRPSPSGCCASLDTRLFAVEALRKKEAKKKPQRASR